MLEVSVTEASQSSGEENDPGANSVTQTVLQTSLIFVTMNNFSLGTENGVHGFMKFLLVIVEEANAETVYGKVSHFLPQQQKIVLTGPEGSSHSFVVYRIVLWLYVSP